MREKHVEMWEGNKAMDCSRRKDLACTISRFERVIHCLRSSVLNGYPTVCIDIQTVGRLTEFGSFQIQIKI